MNLLRVIYYAIFFSLLFFIDQHTKKIIIEGFRFKYKFFEITLVYNEGSAFGIKLLEANQYIIVNSIILLMFILFIWYKVKKSVEKEYYLWALVLIVAGGVGNISDRIIHGKVIDFISIYIFPVFNFADVYISLGVIIMIYLLYKEEQRKKDV